MGLTIPSCILYVTHYKVLCGPAYPPAYYMYHIIKSSVGLTIPSCILYVTQYCTVLSGPAYPPAYYMYHIIKSSVGLHTLLHIICITILHSPQWACIPSCILYVSQYCTVLSGPAYPPAYYMYHNIVQSSVGLTIPSCILYVSHYKVYKPFVGLTIPSCIIICTL